MGAGVRNFERNMNNHSKHPFSYTCLLQFHFLKAVTVVLIQKIMAKMETI